MNKELSTILNARMGELPFIDLQAGLVQVIEYASEAQDGKALPTRLPGAWDYRYNTGGGAFTDGFSDGFLIDSTPGEVNCLENVGNAQDLVPNSRLRGVSYFEDYGSTPGTRVGRGIIYDSKLRLVVWVNRNLIAGSETAQVTRSLIAHINKRLVGGNPWNSYPFTRVTVRPGQVQPQDKSVFAKYTYDEKVVQYLMPPFEFFAMDMVVNYTVPHGCEADFTVTQTPIIC